MAIVNKLTTLMPAFGAPTEYLTLTAQNQPISVTTTNTLTGFINYVRSGRIRAKTTALVSSTITGVEITGTDGTNVVILYQDTTTRTLGGTNFFDFLYSFISEFNLTSISVLITNGAGAALTMDFEVTGNP